MIQKKGSVTRSVNSGWLIRMNLCLKFTTCVTRRQYSYWKYALEKFGLQQKEIKNSRFKRIDHFWSKVSEIIDDNGHKKYPQLFNRVKCVFSLSHANSVPERGFLINKLLLKSHGYTMKGTIVESFSSG